jgi:hypothetical protein
MIPLDGEPYDILYDPVACIIVNGIRRYLNGMGGHREEMEAHSVEYNRRSLLNADKVAYDLLVEKRVAYNLIKRQLNESLGAYTQQICIELSVSTGEWSEMSASQRKNRVVACHGLSSKLAVQWSHIQEQQRELKMILQADVTLQPNAKRSFRFSAPRSLSKRLAKAFEIVSSESQQNLHVHLTKIQVANIWTRWHKAQSEINIEK